MSTGGPDFVFDQRDILDHIDVGDYVTFSADKTMHKNALYIALNSTCMYHFDVSVLLEWV